MNTQPPVTSSKRVSAGSQMTLPDWPTIAVTCETWPNVRIRTQGPHFIFCLLPIRLALDRTEQCCGVSLSTLA
jgi:hypothetical protein